MGVLQSCTNLGRIGLVATVLALATACHDTPTNAPVPTSIQTSTSSGIHATVGTTLTPAPTFSIRDANGTVLAGIPVTVAVTEGGGTIWNAARRTTSGETAVGQWTIGTQAGRNALTITAGSLSPLVIEVNGTPDAPRALTKLAGDAQSAFAGDNLAAPLAVKVADRHGNAISGLDVTFSVSAGGGAISSPTQKTDATGATSGIQWRLGRGGGEQSILAVAGALSATFSATIRSEYAPIVRFYGTPPSQEIQNAFLTAAGRVQALVVGDLTDVLLQSFDLSRCGVSGGQSITETVDDVLIYATVAPIDGPGKILGSAGPCVVRSQSTFAVIGIMRFDVDDLNALAASGRLDAVILHEMLHVVGFGTLWRTKDLVFGSGTTDPRFTGLVAATRCFEANGATICADGRVPLENIGGSGTVESHWRETSFDTELMTGFVEATPVMPLSAVTLASLEDLGLTVNYLAIDPYTFPSVSARVSPGGPGGSTAPWEILEFPRFDVTPAGWVRPAPWK